jgi:hypothetical protein
MEELIDKMQREIIKKIENLNSGGCPVFAYYFSSILTDLNIPHKVTLCDVFPEHVLSGFKRNYTVEHLLIYFPGIGYVDGYNTYNKSELKRKYHCFRSNKYLLSNLKLYAFEEEWNHWYSRSQNKELLKIIKEHFNEKTIARINLPQSKNKTICFSKEKVSV